MTGFININVVDLDTIDVSNLNRQFLFRKQYVGQSKAHVAALAAMEFNTDAKIVSYHANIKDAQFGIEFISKHNIVLNALDNLDARRFVNRLCLAANIPLIESGTTGYLGQVMPIIKKETACYECNPKSTQKVYPICTIRSTPDKPIHCIVWAKEFLKLLFGNSSESMLFEDQTEHASEKSTYMDATILPTETSIETVVSYAKRLLTALYHDEIEKRVALETYKAAAKLPVPVDVDLLGIGAKLAMEYLTQRQSHTSETTLQTRTPGWEQRVWSTEETISELIITMYEIISGSDRANNVSADPLFPAPSASPARYLLGAVEFDKDDQTLMRLVTAAANLRSSIFAIEQLSYYTIKGLSAASLPCSSCSPAPSPNAFLFH